MKKGFLFAILPLIVLATACGGDKKTNMDITAAPAIGAEEGNGEAQESGDPAAGLKDAKEVGPLLPPAPSAPPETAVPPETAAPPVAAIPAGEGASQAEKIQHIRDVYGRTVQNQDSYRQSGGKYYMADGTLAKAVTSNGNPVLDEAMEKNGYSAYGVEYYYEDQPGVDPYPIFIYAVIDKKEYRYYFCRGEFIRRVGPEGGGNTNDSPEMNSFIQALRDEGASYRQGAPFYGPGTATPPAGQLSHADKIAYIQGVYQRIEQDLSPYRREGYHYYNDNYAQRIMVSTREHIALDNVMEKNGYTAYTLTYYYDHKGYSEYFAGNPVLIHGTIDGKEYWYYFYGGELIRRVGPEGGGNTNDTPTSNAFIEAIYNEGAYMEYARCGA